MKLLVDIGNSRIKWVAYAHGTYGTRGALSWRAARAQRLVEDAFRPLPRPEAVVVANVGGRGVAEHVVAACEALWRLAPVAAHAERRRLGVTNAYTDPGQLGVDRWLALLAAWAGRPGPACIAGCGTALTVDGLGPDGNHVGGLIVPGVDLMERLLIEQTDGISESGAGPAVADFGRSTGDCVRNGAALAQASVIDRAAGWMCARYGADVRLLITGGAADRVLPLLHSRFEHEPDLVFRGLALIAEGAE